MDIKMILRLSLFVVAVIIFPGHALAEEATTTQSATTESVDPQSTTTEPTASQPSETEPAVTQPATIQPAAAPPPAAVAPPVAAAPPAVVPASAPSKPSRWFYGATFGAGFGDVKYAEISPMIGRKIGKRTSLGGSFTYRYRKDTRFQEDLSTTDYGTTVFARFNVVARLYLQAEYEYLDYEYVNTINTTARDSFDSLLAGIGMSSPMGKNASMYFTALYNFNYDDTNSPYTEPVSIRIGVGLGF